MRRTLASHRKYPSPHKEMTDYHHFRQIWLMELKPAIAIAALQGTECLTWLGQLQLP